ncbi:MAG: SulP family inorganic anion transporter, partial [Pseudomonadota bacterium]
PKKLGKYVPGALAALLIGTGVSLLLPAMPILGSIPTGLPDIIIPKISSDSAVIIFKAAVVLALLGTIDSLLTSLVADNMTRTRHNSNQELVGQGIGNAIAGLFGGIPGAGATMRTVVNIRSGGLTKISGMIHSLLLLAVVLVLAPLAEKIPHAVLAGILVKVGYDIIDWQYLSRAHRGPRWDLVLMVLVLGLTVFVDLITAVVAGVALAALAFTKQLADSQLKAFSEAPAQMTDPEEHRLMQAAKGKISLFEFSGPLSFGAAADAAHRVRGRLGGDVEVIILDFSRLPFLDISAARAVDSISGDAAEAGLAVYASGMNDAVKKTLKGLKADNHIPTDMRFSNRIDALREAVSDLSNPAEAAIT